MKEKGYISKVIAYKRYYIVTSFEREERFLFFEELLGNKFINGDIIEYEIVESKEFGKCALNPEKVGNIYLEELKKTLDNDSLIEGYVYEKNEGGYLVSYNGYNCFLPNIESVYKTMQPADNFINTYQIFKVISVENNKVVLSKKSLLKEDLIKLRLNEVADLRKGFTFIGKVKRVQGFGVFVNYKHSEGLLHISNILSSAAQYLTKRDKNSVQAIMSKVFLEGREVMVTVDNINDTQFSVVWNKAVEPNKEICIELNSFGLLT